MRTRGVKQKYVKGTELSLGLRGEKKENPYRRFKVQTSAEAEGVVSLTKGKAKFRAKEGKDFVRDAIMKVGCRGRMAN